MSKRERPIRVAMLMTDLDDLGVQRVVINLFNHFDRAKIDTTLVLWKKEGKVASFLSDQGVVIETDHGLRRPRLFFRLFEYLRIIRQLKPDVVLSCVPVTNISYALIKWLLPKKTAFIASEHAFFSRAFNSDYHGAFQLLYRAMFHLTYNHLADRLIMTANVGKQDAVDNWGLKPQIIKVIYNPQDIAELQHRAQEPLDDPWFQPAGEPILIGAGRLTKQKGFASLIQAFALLNKTTPCRLAILGRGELDQSLKQLASELGVDHKVRFLGFQTNHLKYIRHASVFVLSSIWEAMPMIVAEAMAIGTPIVSFDCPSGPFEMLDGGECGYLVADQDVNAMVETLAKVVKDTEGAKQKANKALSKVQQFDVARIVESYQQLIAEVVAEKSYN